MSYVNCPRCRLTVRLRDDALTPEHCPRCAAKHGVQSKVYLSATPARLFSRPEGPVVDPTRPAAPA
jgi:uncharacterized paraquat-inducible protein A